MRRHFHRHGGLSQTLPTSSHCDRHNLHATSSGCDGLLRSAESNRGQTSTQSDLHATPCPRRRPFPDMAPPPGNLLGDPDTHMSLAATPRNIAMLIALAITNA